jgi:hypothetical protein
MVMTGLLKTNPHLRTMADLRRAIRRAVSDSSAFEGVRVPAVHGAPPRSMASAKKPARGR